MAEEEEKKQPKSIQKGDYVIHCHVHECRELKARDSGDTNDPVCQVTVFKEQKATKIHEKTLSCVFDERLVWECPGKEVDEIKQGKVMVELFDANVLFPNVLIGAFEFDMEEVYYKEHHELYKQWVALTDVTDANEGVQGYLQVTIVVLGPDDEQYIHDEAAEAAEAAGSGGLLNVLMPPTIEQDPKLLRVHVYRVEKLPSMDTTFTGAAAAADPYVQVLFAGIDNRTEPIMQVQDAAIMKTLTVPVVEPVMSRNIVVSIKDYDLGLSDEAHDLIGTFIFDWKELKKTMNMEPRWVHVYGAPITSAYWDTIEQDKMNRGVLPGSQYRGSMMLAMDIVEDDEPKKEVIDAAWNDAMEPELQRYALEIDVYQAVECKNSIGRFRLELQIRNMTLSTEFADSIQGTVEWYDIFTDPNTKEDTIFLNMPDDFDQCPDLIFYLIEERTGRFSYKRFSWGDVCAMGWGNAPKWYAFVEDKVSYEYTDEDFPGNVLMGIRAGPATWKPPKVLASARPFLVMGHNEMDDDEKVTGALDALERSSREKSPVPRGRTATLNPGQATEAPTTGNLVLSVMKCDYLPENAGDVYVEVTHNGVMQSTTTIRNKTNPEWNQPFDFRPVSIHDTLRVSVKSSAYLGVSRTKLGELERIVLMTIVNEAAKESKQPVGSDFIIEKKFFINESAMVTLKFQFQYHKGRKGKKKRNLPWLRHSRVGDLGRPYPANFQMRIYVFQARDLEPKDDNGLSDPYFRVSYCGQKDQTKCITKNLNPQWLQMLLMNVTVPQPAEYAPRIQCAVYDSDDDRFGLSQGYFDDMMGRFFVSFQECLDMAAEKKPRWFGLQDKFGDKVSGEVYMAIQFSDPNVDASHAFSVDVQTQDYYLHILTLGVRALQSSLGITKPQIFYTTNKGKEVHTDPSSNPSPSDANFRVVKKVPLELPNDFEMAPSIDIVAQDNKFGGMFKNVLGHGSLRLDKFMEPIKNHPDNHWNIKYMRQTILNEEEIKREEEAEEEVLDRVEAVERRCERVSLRKIVLQAEAEMSGKRSGNYDEQMNLIEEYAAKQVTAQDAIVYKKKKDAVDEEEVSETEEKSEEPEEVATATVAVTEEENVLSAMDLGMPDDDDEDETKTKGVDDLEREFEEQLKRADDEAKEAERLRDEEAEANQTSLEEIEKAKQKKKKSKKERDKAKLKAWERGEKEFAFDIEAPVTWNPEDDIPEYMKGRERVKDELEDQVKMEPFENIDLWTGQNGSFGGLNERRVIGQLKGLWRLDRSEKNPFGKGLTALVQTRTVAVRVYILKGRGLFPMDSDNTSDPYLIVRLGKLEFSTVERYIENTLNPKFHESFEFMSKIPGPSKLEIEVWDYDFLGHDLIGTTVVDIEDRWFSKEWRRMKLKPLEERTLRNPRSKASYGKIELWVDMLTKDDARNTPMLDISLPPPEEYELRVICWKAKHVTIKDTFTEQNDLYAQVQLDGDEQQVQYTDTHFRAKMQKASWNWRMLFPITLNMPLERPWHIRFSMFDFDFIGAADNVGEIGFGLDMLLREIYKNKEQTPKMVLKKGNKKQFWLEVFHPDFEGGQGKLSVSMEIMTREHAEKNPAGLGRSDPNINPYLPPPEGRLIWTMNPFVMLRQLLGDKLCAKLCGLFCLAILIVLAVFAGPMLLLNWISRLLAKL